MVSKEEIYTRFPRIFPEKTLNFGDGWNQIVYEACDYLQNIFEANYLSSPHYEQFTITSSKEKFGTLRISSCCVKLKEEVEQLSAGDKEWYERWRQEIECTFDFAEYRSEITCEITGLPGKLYYTASDWVKTLCEEEAKKQNARLI